MSRWVRRDARGRLVYRRTTQGDRIIDFSSAGYGGGGVPIPRVPVVKTVAPSGRDDSRRIQKAIDAVSRRVIVNGFRGAVLLSPGQFRCRRPLIVRASGVVLRGSGSGVSGTELRMTGNPHVAISIRARGIAAPSGKRVRIADCYVPSGETRFTVQDVSGFEPGDRVLVCRPVTNRWLTLLGMNSMRRRGRRQIWIRGETICERSITAITGNQITVDVPLSDSLDAQYLGRSGATMVRCDSEDRIRQIGVEHLRITTLPQAIDVRRHRHHRAIRIEGAEDVWLRDLEILETVNSVFLGARRVTVEEVRIKHSLTTIGGARGADFTAAGSQILLHRCSVMGDDLFYFVTGPRVSGPNVLLKCRFKGNGFLQPHARWATGLLIDSCVVPGGGIDLMNRGEMGSGHGWTIGWAVAWNCRARRFLIQNPPGAANWAVGCIGLRESATRPFTQGPVLPEGNFDSHGRPVLPRSLYEAQLRERLCGTD